MCGIVSQERGMTYIGDEDEVEAQVAQLVPLAEIAKGVHIAEHVMVVAAIPVD